MNPMDINDRVAAFRDNPQGLQQRYAMSQDLLDLMALQKITKEKQDVARQMQLDAAQQGTPPTVAKQLEGELVSMTKEEMAKQMGGLGQQQMRSQGIAGLPAPNMSPQALATGGVVRGFSGQTDGSYVAPELEMQTGPATKLMAIAKKTPFGRAATEMFDSATQQVVSDVRRAIDGPAKPSAPSSAENRKAVNAADDRSAAPEGRSKQEEFVYKHLPAAQRVAAKLNVPVDAVLGQWALETSWGEKMVPDTNNLGNIKVGGSGKPGVMATDNATGSRDLYRKYESTDAAADDFAEFLQGKRYSKVAGAKDAQGYFGALKAAGYAEDPDYVSKGTGVAGKIAGILDTARSGKAPPAWAPQPAGQPNNAPQSTQVASTSPESQQGYVPRRTPELSVDQLNDKYLREQLTADPAVARALAQKQYDSEYGSQASTVYANQMAQHAQGLESLKAAQAARTASMDTGRDQPYWQRALTATAANMGSQPGDPSGLGGLAGFNRGMKGFQDSESKHAQDKAQMALDFTNEVQKYVQAGWPLEAAKLKVAEGRYGEGEKGETAARAGKAGAAKEIMDLQDRRIQASARKDQTRTEEMRNLQIQLAGVEADLNRAAKDPTSGKFMDPKGYAVLEKRKKSLLADLDALRAMRPGGATANAGSTLPAGVDVSEFKVNRTG